MGEEDESTATTGLTIVGRSSSLFTRVARIYAAELGVPHGFQVVPDLASRVRDDFAGNPALKVPILQIAGGQSVFGTLNICRELARRSTSSLRLLWPEDLDRVVLTNAHELTTQAMATEVSLIMASHSGVGREVPYLLKLRESLSGSLAWLDDCLKAESANLAGRGRLSFFEACLFCLVTHLEFRGILDVSGFTVLGAFCGRFGERPAAQLTPYKFDATSAHR
jgi:glutathione S-transferase